MKLSLLLITASTSMTTAWNVTTYTDNNCSENAQVWHGEDSRDCVGLYSVARSIKVSGMPADKSFQTSSGYACNSVLLSGGNGCYNQSLEYRSFSVSLLERRTEERETGDGERRERKMDKFLEEEGIKLQQQSDLQRDTQNDSQDSGKAERIEQSEWYLG